MEVKERYVLLHTSGLYLSWSPDEYPLTKRLSRARRFYKPEDISEFLQNSFYKPDDPDAYKPQLIEIEYRLKNLQLTNHPKGVETDVQQK